ncbi:MAG: ATP-dependent DNA helicase RecG [Chloroflexi bacterium]|nr:ATP-dependent DNA helicase RecG [Chloroflexota bacterium]
MRAHPADSLPQAPPVQTRPRSRRPSKREAFQRILLLEEQRGYEDRAVSGGLDRFLARWRQEAGPEGDALLARLKAARLLEASYQELLPERRQRWVRRALECLEAPSNGPAAPVQPAGAAPARQDKTRAAPQPLSPDQPVAALRAYTPRLAPTLGRLGVATVHDLLYCFPRRHNTVLKVADLQPDEEQTVVGTLWEPRKVRLGRSMEATEAAIGDDTGNIRVVWFQQPYLAQRLKPNEKYVFSGRVRVYRGRREMESPQVEDLRPGGGLDDLAQPGRLFPVYPLTEGLTQRALRRLVREALGRAAPGVEEALPQELQERHQFLPVGRALWQAHYPDSLPRREESRRRLAFEELFLLQLNVLRQRHALEAGASSVALLPPRGLVDSFLASLPFALTAAQRRVLQEVLADLTRGPRPMGRLLQGEVGSGKTVVALAALLVAAACGYQGAMMAPTEVLAEQHFLTVSRLLEGLARPRREESLLAIYLDPCPRPITIGLLVGSMTEAQKDELHRLLADGALDIVLGTHALIQEEVAMPRLALAVVDEQHRFGVLQRAALRRRGVGSPHLLVMSATPIPRSLALTLYGDLDLSTLDELPPGRQQVQTKVIKPERRGTVYQFLRREVQAGHQAFVIYPLIDESEAVNARAAVKEQERLAREVFPDLRVGLLHGQMPMEKKQQVMESFRQGRLDVLVSTPVVEVGIDVPNATIMLVDGADRFGLAQLHQFRGRVGRGPHPSYCILVAESPSQEARRRLSALEKIADGFKLAEVDLELRGPGEFFGTRQSGLPDLRMARLSDQELLLLARREAQALLDRDPELALPQHRPLARALARLRPPVAGDVS